MIDSFAYNDIFKNQLADYQLIVLIGPLKQHFKQNYEMKLLNNNNYNKINFILE